MHKVNSGRSVLYKILNQSDEKYWNIKLKGGINILDEEYILATRNKPNISPALIREANELVIFTNSRNIFSLLRPDSIFVIEVELLYQYDNFSIKQYQCDDNIFYKANRFRLGVKHNLKDLETIKMLILRGANIHQHYDYIQRWAFDNHQYHIVQYLIHQSFCFRIDNFYVLLRICRCNKLDLLKIMEECGLNNTVKNYAMILSYICGSNELTEYLFNKKYTDTDFNCIYISSWKSTLPIGNYNQNIVRASQQLSKKIIVIWLNSYWKLLIKIMNLS